MSVYAAFPPALDVQRIRTQLGLDQTTFAKLFGIKPKELMHWERGSRHPDHVHRHYLLLIQEDPMLVAELINKVYTKLKHAQPSAH